MAQDAKETINASFNFDKICTVDNEKNWRKRILWEAWHSMVDLKGGNEHMQIPTMYESPITF